MSELTYHLMELEIARSANDPRRVMPLLPDRFESILDIGCGAGQTLIACSLKPGTFACGVDIDQEALAYGRKMSTQIEFIRASGEQLPFADQTFEVVISRIALPYMHVPTALAEFERVLKPGGQIWLALHPASLIFSQLGKALKGANVKSFVYQIYVILNSLIFHWTGAMFRDPLKRSNCESFQTVGGISRAMRKAGFEQVRTQRSKSFTVTAVKLS